MKRLIILLTIIPTICSGQTTNYLDYHNEIIKAEEYIVARQFGESLKIYRKLTDTYAHVFLRDIKVAAQLSAYISDTDNLFCFLEHGMKKGWTLKEIMKRQTLKKFKTDKRWEKLKINQDQFKKEFQNSINLDLRKEVREMLVKDQKRAIRVALTPVKKWREIYTNRKFIPNNRQQVRRINKIIDEVGYPGEKIIGDKSWATVMISHNEHDTIYNELRPKLYSAYMRGEISAIEIALIETWRTGVDTGWKDKAFLIFEQDAGAVDIVHADSLRQRIGLRSVELNNKLIGTEKELGMKFYLSPSHGGLITIKE